MFKNSGISFIVGVNKLETGALLGAAKLFICFLLILKIFSSSADEIL